MKKNNVLPEERAALCSTAYTGEREFLRSCVQVCKLVSQFLNRPNVETFYNEIIRSF